MKVTESEGTKCFVATLNASNSALPEAVLNASATVSNIMVIILTSSHRLLKIRTDGSQSRDRELGSIGIFCIFTTILVDHINSLKF